MPGWGLRQGAFVGTLFIFAGSFDYVSAHPKNAAAPLQPPVEGDAAAPAAPPTTPAPGQSATPLPQLVPNRGRPRPTIGPGALITLQPGVHATALPSISITHVS